LTREWGRGSVMGNIQRFRQADRLVGPFEHCPLDMHVVHTSPGLEGGVFRTGEGLRLTPDRVAMARLNGWFHTPSSSLSTVRLRRQLESAISRVTRS